MSIVELSSPSVEQLSESGDRQSRFSDAQIDMAHGAGGLASRRLIEDLIVRLLGGLSADSLNDAAFLNVAGARIAISTDAFVVRPLLFPGGSIGELAVNGTVNDLVVAGAQPRALVVSLVLEAGLRSEVLEREIRAMAAAAARAGIAIVGGDTKVVEHGKADGMYITTTGIGVADSRVSCSPARVRPGDRVLVSGLIGDHGTTILLARGDIDLEADLESDTRSIEPLVTRLIEEVGFALHWMRDPTRGGVATALNELARDCGHSIVVFEDRVPLRPEVRGACELLGLDPLHIANEGQFLAVLAPEHADAALAALHSVPGGEQAALIGEVREQPKCTVLGVSPYGGARAIDMLVGDPLPRIC
ncbi:MAG TPA: hydrogenase expression/formation protein HypE [Gemmatimonadaceae bacterium]|nr:hydrogenase expression/formation protein HypE [Gemmatimonadaceae bacterium]